MTDEITQQPEDTNQNSGSNALPQTSRKIGQIIDGTFFMLAISSVLLMLAGVPWLAPIEWLGLALAFGLSSVSNQLSRIERITETTETEHLSHD